MVLPNPNRPLVGVDADFTVSPPNKPGVNTMSLSSRGAVVTDVSARRGRQNELGRCEAGTAAIMVHDPNELLNPLNTGSAFNSGGNSIQPYRGLWIWSLWNLANGGYAGNILNSGNAAPGQPSLGSAYGPYGYDPSFESWNPGFFYLSTDSSFSTVTTLPSGPLNSNTGFETGIPPWVVTGGTVVQSGTQKHSGSFSAQLTPNGTSAQNFIESEQVAVTAGNLYCATAWVWFTSAVTTNCSVSVNWFNSAHTYLSTSSVNVSAPAGVWTQVQNTFTAPANAAFASLVPTLSGTPAAAQVWYIDDASITNATNPADATYSVVKVSLGSASSVMGWIPRATPGAAYTLYMDVYAPTGATITFSYGSYSTTTTATGTYQTLTLPITASAGTWLQFKATTTGAFPVVMYFANYRIQGLSPGWSQTAGSAMSYTQAQAHGGAFSLGTVMQASTDSMSVPLLTAPDITYTMSCWVYAVGAGSVVRMSVGGSTVSSSVVGAWQQLAVTFNATDAITTVSWSATAGTFPVSFYLDDVQFEIGASVSASTTSGPTYRYLHTGWIERYAPSWVDAGMRGVRQLESVDALSILSRVNINQSYAATTLADKPTVYIPYGDSAFPQAVQLQQGGQPFMGYTQIGAQSGAVTFGGDTFLDGTKTVSLTQQNYNPPRASDNSLITYLGTRQGGITMNPQSFTLEMWVRFTSGVAYLGAAAMQPGESTATLAAGPQYWVGLYTSGGRLKYVFWDPNGLSTTTLAPLGTGGTWNGYPDGTWHYVVLILQATNSWNSYQDGVLGTPAALAFTPSQSIRLDNFFIDSTTYFGDAVSNISVANMAVYPTALSSTQLANHYNRGAGYVGELSGARANRLLTQYWGSNILTATGRSVMSNDYYYNGKSLLSVLQDIADTEDGLVWADGAGVVRFDSRETRYLNSPTPSFTFGEKTSAGELPYKDLKFDFDPNKVYNAAAISNPAGTVFKAGSGPRVFTKTAYLQSDWDVQQAANFYAGRYATARMRVSKMVIDPASYPALWRAALTLDVGDRITIIKRTPAFTMTDDYYIEQLQHDIRPLKGEWIITYQLSPVFVPTVGKIGDATYGVLGSTTYCIY